LTCREFVEFLIDYVDEALPAEQRRVFDEHMGFCPACLNYLETYRETVRLEKTLCADPEGPVPDDVPDDLVQAILAARRA
jgi:anti-sigma factor RsiW